MARVIGVIALVLCAAASAYAQLSCNIGGVGPLAGRLAANVVAGPGVVANALNAKRAQANHWLHNMLVAAGGLGIGAAPAMRATPVSDLLMMGSHDAGTAQADVHHIPALVNTNWFVTQSYTIADQLCLGTRFFDLRFKWCTAGGGAAGFRINHENGYFATDAVVWNDLATFLADHPHEIVFIRIKVVGGSAVNTANFWNAMQVALAPFAEQHAPAPVGGGPGPGAAENVGARTLGAIWAPAPGVADHAAGRVFVMRYECQVTPLAGPAVACAGGDFGGAPAQAIQFDVAASIWGRYSDSNNREEVMLKHWNAPPGTLPAQIVEDKRAGQLQKWDAWNTMVAPPAGKPMFAFWWTSTGAFGRALNVKENTKKLYIDDDNDYTRLGSGIGRIQRDRDPMFGLHRLYHAVNDLACNFGSFIVVDFIGDSVVQKTKHLAVSAQPTPGRPNPPDLVFNFILHVNTLRFANPRAGAAVWPAAVCAESYSNLLKRTLRNYNFKQNLDVEHAHEEHEAEADVEADEHAHAEADAEAEEDEDMADANADSDAVFEFADEADEQAEEADEFAADEAEADEADADADSDA